MTETRVVVPVEVVKRLNWLRKRMEKNPNFIEAEIKLEDGTILVLKNEN